MSQASSSRVIEESLPKILLRNYQKYGDSKVAMRWKDYGIWQEYTWKDYYEKVKYFSLGIISLGLEPDDKVAIVGDNDPYWYWTDIAILAAGGVPVGIYNDSNPEEIYYLVDHSEASFVLAKDQEQVDKVLSIKDKLPRVKKVVYWDPKGLWDYEEPMLMTFDEVVELGKEFEQEHPRLFEENVDKITRDDMATLSYTSGTTGVPKGAMITQNNLIVAARNLDFVDPWYPDDEYVSFQPPGWITEQLFGIGHGLFSATIIDFPEEPETVEENIREVGSRIVMYGARLWESVASMIQVKMIDASALSRFCYGLVFPVGYKVADLGFENKKPNLFWRALYALCHLIFFRPLQDKLGLLKTRIVYTAGAPLSPENLRFFHALGIKIRQAYGQTECGLITGHRTDDVRAATQGVPFPNVEIRITEEQEISARGAGVFKGYYKDSEATAKIIKGGWLHTGDAGYIDDYGHLHFMDRVKDLVELADGKKYAPTYIEGTLKFSPYIKDAMVIGGEGRPYVTTLINMEFENVGKWAEAHHMAYTTFVDLSQRPEVAELISKDVERTNRSSPPVARIRRYVVLHKEFDPDEAELTRTRKIRRDFMEQRYKGLLDAIYSGESEYVVEAEVKYRDGRKSVVRTALKINSVELGEDK